MPKVFNIVLSTFFKDIYEDTKTKPRMRIVMGLVASVLVISLPLFVYFSGKAVYFHNKYTSADEALLVKDKKDAETINRAVAMNVPGKLPERNIPNKAQAAPAPVMPEKSEKKPEVTTGKKKAAVEADDIVGRDLGGVRQRHIGSTQLDSVLAVIKDTQKEVLVYSASLDAESVHFQKEIVDSLLGRGFPHTKRGQGKVSGEYVYGTVSISKSENSYTVIIYPQNVKVQK